MLRGRSDVAFVSSVSSGAASSPCLFWRRGRLSLLWSLRGWIATTACSPARLRASWTDSSRFSMPQRGSSATGGSMTTSHRSSAMFSNGCQSHSASSTSCLLVFLSLHGAAPEYLRDCCIGTHSSASGLRLRSLERTDPQVRWMRTHFGDCAFSAAGPRCWNSLSPAIHLVRSVDSFKAQLKTPMFAKAYLLRVVCEALL